MILTKEKIKHYIIKTLKVLVPIIIVLFIAFMFEVGLGKWGVWGFVGLTLIVSAYRLYTGWDQFNLITELGADQLGLLLNQRKKDKQQKKKIKTRLKK